MIIMEIKMCIIRVRVRDLWTFGHTTWVAGTVSSVPSKVIAFFVPSLTFVNCSVLVAAEEVVTSARAAVTMKKCGRF